MQRMIAANVYEDSYQQHIHLQWYRKGDKTLQNSDRLAGITISGN